MHYKCFKNYHVARRNAAEGDGSRKHGMQVSPVPWEVRDKGLGWARCWMLPLLLGHVRRQRRQKLSMKCPASERTLDQPDWAVTCFFRCHLGSSPAA